LGPDKRGNCESSEEKGEALVENNYSFVYWALISGSFSNIHDVFPVKSNYVMRLLAFLQHLRKVLPNWPNPVRNHKNLPLNYKKLFGQNQIGNSFEHFSHFRT
jgi:hypothetical protein